MGRTARQATGLEEGVHAVPCEWPLPPGPSRWWRGFAAGERKVCAVFAQGLVIDHAGTLACAEARRRVQRDILLCTSLYFFVPRETALVHSSSQSARMPKRACRPDDLGLAQTEPWRAQNAHAARETKTDCKRPV